MACSTAASEVRPPGTTSTSGIRCGGLNGCPTSTRSGWAGQARWIREGASPEELLARTVPGGAAASRTANSRSFSSGRSGPFSCTNSASATASARSGVNDSRRWSAATAARSRSSAPGAGSLATTRCPWERKSVAQDAPMTPVPTTAILTRRSRWPAGRRTRRRGPASRDRRGRRCWRRTRGRRRAGSASPAPPASCRCGCAGRPPPAR